MDDENYHHLGKCFIYDSTFLKWYLDNFYESDKVVLLANEAAKAATYQKRFLICPSVTLESFKRENADQISRMAFASIIESTHIEQIDIEDETEAIIKLAVITDFTYRNDRVYILTNKNKEIYKNKLKDLPISICKVDTDNIPLEPSRQ